VGVERAKSLSREKLQRIGGGGGRIPVFMQVFGLFGPPRSTDFGSLQGSLRRSSFGALARIDERGGLAPKAPRYLGQKRFFSSN
jgi:hypothetical protein